MPKQYYYTQEIIHFCYLFGKPFVFLKDVDGHIYGVPAIENEDGTFKPDLTR
jgi:hypothetical protein